MNKQFEVVLLGSDMNTYGFARSLHEQYGINSHSIGKLQLNHTKYSKLLNHHIVDKFEDEKVFVKALLDLYEELQCEKVLLIACGDTYVDKILENRQALENKFILPYIDLKLANKLQHKTSFYNLCEEYGLDYPKTQVVSKATYQSLDVTLKYPIVLKAANSVMYWLTEFEGRKKAFLIHNEEQLENTLHKIYNSTYDDEFIMQEFIPGDDSSIAVVNNYSTKEGRVVMQTFGNVLLEDHAPNGIGSHMAIISGEEPELLNKIKNLLEDLNYVGFANFDLKYDSRDKKYKFFEINLRQGRSSFFTTNAGCNLGKYVVEDYIFNNKLEYETGIPNKLWSVIPKSVIMKYVKNSEMKEKFLKVYKENGYCNSLIYNKDLNFKRHISQLKDFYLQNLRYLKHFSDKEL
ncbi:MAG: ATP-grasp domain-containing protein [Bacilli bacterium]